MKRKYTVEIEVDGEELEAATGKKVTAHNIEAVVEEEFGWLAQSGISLVKLNPINNPAQALK